MNDGTVKIGVELDDKQLKKSTHKTYTELEKDTNKTIKELKKEVDTLASKYINSGKTIKQAYKQAYQEMNLQAKVFSKNTLLELQKLPSSFQNIKNVGVSAFKGIATAITTVSAGIGAFSIGIINAGKDFESQMSRVEAISGATTEQLSQLEQKAMELGRTTQFSATESAKALEYMALAGFKTEDMLESLSGVMNLASASGEDLALVSDILTDGLTAFGLTAKESEKFADVLASTASNANTNIAMLGESFKYVAPVAGALGINIEDTALALGLMANAGIKASSSGTALRTLLSNLASPSKNVATALEQLGIATKNAQGDILPLNEILLQLRDSFQNLTTAEKAQYAEMLSGKEGMSGLLAIVNASTADFNKLSNAINNSTGAAKEMAKITQDNLQGQITALKSNLEGLSIAISQNLENPLKTAVSTINNEVSKLQSAFENGGITGLFEQLGSSVAILASKIAAEIPKIIELSNELINNFIKGLLANKDQLSESAIQIMETIMLGIINTLPAMIDLTIQFIGSLITKTIEYIEENKDKIINKIKEITTQILDTFSENIPIFKVVTDALKALINNFEILSSVVIGAVSALVLYKNALLIQNLITGVTNAIKNFSIATTVATNAQKLLNLALKANPIGIVITLIGALIGYLVNLYKTNETFRDIVVGVWNTVKAVVTGVVENFVTFFTETIPNSIKTMLDFMKNLPMEMFNIGKDLVKGLWNGIQNMNEWIKQKITNFASGIMDNIKGFFGIHSPSRKMRDEVGTMLVRGMALGVEKESNTLIKSLINPYKKASNELNVNNNPFTNSILEMLKDTREKAEQESTNFAQVGENITKTLSENISLGIQNLGVIDYFNNNLQKLKGIVQMSNKMMIPTSNNPNTSISNKNITNNQGDFVVKIENINTNNSTDIETLLYQMEFYNKQRQQAKGV